MGNPANKIATPERNLDEQESIRSGLHLARLRELLLEGAASEPGTEPMNAEYFEKLRDRILNKGNEGVSKR